MVKLVVNWFSFPLTVHQKIESLSLSLSLSQGLADESEFIRDTSLQAGQTIVNRYADKAVELFLPQLEQGLFDENWRIR